ncbi:hypothetical protein ACH5RR_021382 [Cinchona calisaya]|uniref:Uncharacterized protein n=1 Tax=Cinchona calisaya TaxID=153742 RepID=A0ABD2ZM42_9GENT
MGPLCNFHMKNGRMPFLIHAMYYIASSKANAYSEWKRRPQQHPLNLDQSVAVISNGFGEVTSIKSHLLPQLHPRSSGEVQHIKASDNSREKRELDRDKEEKKGREQEDWRDKNVKGKAKNLRNTIWWTQPELRPKPNSRKKSESCDKRFPSSNVAIRLRRVQNLPFSKPGTAWLITRIYLLISRILGPKRSSLKYRDRKDKCERASSLEAEYRATSDCLKELATEIWKLPVQKL